MSAQAAIASDLLQKHQANISRLAQTFGLEDKPAIESLPQVETPFDLDGFKTRLTELAKEPAAHEESFSDSSVANILRTSTEPNQQASSLLDTLKKKYAEPPKEQQEEEWRKSATSLVSRASNTGTFTLDQILSKYRQGAKETVPTKEYVKQAATRSKELEYESAYERIRQKYMATEKARSPSPVNENLSASGKSQKSNKSRRAGSPDRGDLGASGRSLPPLGMSQEFADSLKSPNRSLKKS